MSATPNRRPTAPRIEPPINGQEYHALNYYEARLEITPVGWDRTCRFIEERIASIASYAGDRRPLPPR